MLYFTLTKVQHCLLRGIFSQERETNRNLNRPRFLRSVRAHSDFQYLLIPCDAMQEFSERRTEGAPRLPIFYNKTRPVESTLCLKINGQQRKLAAITKHLFGLYASK